MKIGILTFHSADNYGAVLQTYASVRFLRSRGHDAFVLDYRNGEIERAYAPFRWDAERYRNEGPVYALKYLPTSILRLCRKLSFNRFRSEYLPMLPFSKACEMDLILVGSDQVWNKNHTGGYDPVYFGEVPAGLKKVAWAASAGKAILSAKEISYAEKNFAAVSVREKNLAESIPGSCLLPDPTSLLTSKEWDSIAGRVKGDYVLAYPMLHQQEVVEEARLKAKELNLALKVISPGIKLGSGWKQTSSPDEFVSLFKGAAYVVTSSFHGAVFTLLFERPHTFVHHGDPRFDTLLSSDISEGRSAAEAFLSKLGA